MECHLKALREKNTYRYRGYRYDTETGYYYLQSRYYNPEWGRFLNIDAIGGNVGALLSHNIFAYCNNNPVISKDSNGFRPMYTQGEETAAMRDASYKVMNNYYSTKSKGKSSSNFSYKESAIQGGISGAIDEVGGWAASFFIKGKNVWKDLDYLTMGKYVTKYSKGAKAAMKGLGIVGSVGMTAWNAKGSFDKGDTSGGVIDIVAGAVGILVGAGATGLAEVAVGAVGFGLSIGAGILIDKASYKIKEYF